jgi:outer membrane biogenesis lipoprotein LolB
MTRVVILAAALTLLAACQSQTDPRWTDYKRIWEQTQASEAGLN